jgi:hypothetical protein
MALFTNLSGGKDVTSELVGQLAHTPQMAHPNILDA